MLQKGNTGMSNKHQVLVIGLDGATFAILQPLIKQGKLPHLAELQQKGSWGTLTSTVPPVTAPAWASFMTGVNPARHGVFNFFKRDLSGYAYEETAGFVHADLVRSPTLWDILSQVGKRVGIVNVPLTYPPRPVNGFMISGMLTPPSTPSFTYPPELGKQLNGYQIDLDHTRTEKGFNQDAHLGEAELLQRVNVMLDHRAEHCLRLMTAEKWDCFVVVFVGTDRLFHELWHYLDPSCAAYSSAQGKKIRQAVETYLGRLDTVVGQLRNAAGPEVITIVMSDHGFGPAPEKRVNLNDWLAEQDLLHVAKSGRSWLKAEFWATNLGLRRPAIKRMLKRWVPLRLLRRAASDKKGRREVPADWDQTRAYAVQMYNHICGIEINLKGRKRRGIVEPGAEYEQLRDLLLARLTHLRDPETGVQVVRTAHRREEIFDGEFLDQSPDIVIELDPTYAGLSPLGNGRIVTPHNLHRQGDHRQEGIFLAQGPNIVPGVVFPSPNITDLTPTILYALGVPVPRRMDGRMLVETFDADYVATHPISYDDADLQMVRDKEDVYSAEEMVEISDRLRSLGYVD